MVLNSLTLEEPSRHDFPTYTITLVTVLATSILNRPPWYSHAVHQSLTIILQAICCLRRPDGHFHSDDAD